MSNVHDGSKGFCHLAIIFSPPSQPPLGGDAFLFLLEETASAETIPDNKTGEVFFLIGFHCRDTFD